MYVHFIRLTPSTHFLPMSSSSSSSDLLIYFLSLCSTPAMDKTLTNSLEACFKSSTTALSVSKHWWSSQAMRRDKLLFLRDSRFKIDFEDIDMDCARCGKPSDFQLKQDEAEDRLSRMMPYYGSDEISSRHFYRRYEPDESSRSDKKTIYQRAWQRFSQHAQLWLSNLVTSPMALQLELELIPLSPNAGYSFESIKLSKKSRRRKKSISIKYLWTPSPPWDNSFTRLEHEFYHQHEETTIKKLPLGKELRNLINIITTTSSPTIFLNTLQQFFSAGFMVESHLEPISAREGFDLGVNCESSSRFS